MRSWRELAALYAVFGLVPIGPVLAVTYAALAWQAAALALMWAACWYLWVWAWLQRSAEREEE